MKITMDAVKTSATASDTTDFEALFDKHWPRVYGLLCRLTGDPDEAQDLALEVFCRLYRHLPAADRTQAIGGWLYRVATRLGYNALRAWKRRTYYEEKAGLQALESGDSGNPAEAAEGRSERLRVRLALSRLKPRSAQMLVLRHAGFSYAEIAATLKISPTSVGTLLARAEKEFERTYLHLER